MAIGMGNLLDAFVENGLTNHVKGGILHMSRPPQAVEVESEADLEALGELPAGSIAYTAEYAHMWQLTGSGTWAATEEKGGGGGGIMLLTPTIDQQAQTVTLNATYNYVKQAMLSGQFVGFYMNDEGFYRLFLAIGCSGAEDSTLAKVTFANADAMNNYSYDFVADSEDGELYLSEQH